MYEPGNHQKQTYHISPVWSSSIKNLGVFRCVDDPDDNAVRHGDAALMGIALSQRIDMKSWWFNACFYLGGTSTKKDASTTRHEGMTDCRLLCVRSIPLNSRRSIRQSNHGSYLHS